MVSLRYFCSLIWSSFHNWTLLTLECIELLIIIVLGLKPEWHYQMSMGLFAIALLATFLVGLLIAASSNHLAQETKIKALEDRLRPKVEVSGVGAPAIDFHRARIRNLTSRVVKFKAELVETSPQLLNLPLPACFHLTHEYGEISPNGDASVDVFAGALPQNGHLTLVANNRDWPQQIPEDGRLKLLIHAYPISEDGVGSKRWFSIVPGDDGRVIFTAERPVP